MVLKIMYEKNGHTYTKNARSYKQMDEKETELKKQGFKILGENLYN